MKPPHFKFVKKATIVLLILLFLVSPIPGAPGVSAFLLSTFPQEYDLVAILVEKTLYQNTQNIGGIPSSQTPVTTLKARIDRFANDIQQKLEKTRAVVITVEKNEPTENIAFVLERLFFEGDPEEPERNARLKGVILIGDVPLPVVNKKGTRFVSLFPYTDFEKKAYLWNQETGDFERDEKSTSPKPEVWHGVIKPPVSADEARYRALFAKFFDKNHLYKTGHPFYSQFGKNIFYADLFWERKNMNPLLLKYYGNFIKHAEDLAYFRTTKELLGQVFGQFQEDVEEARPQSPEEQAQVAAAKEAAKQPAMQQALAEQEAKRADATDRLNNAIVRNDIAAQRSARKDKKQAEQAISAIHESADSEDSEFETNAIPDIQTGPMIRKYLAEFKDLFSKYPALANDFARYTGRYKPAHNLDTFVNLIYAKDKFTFEYLKQVNNMVEHEIDEIVEDELQQDISLLKEATIEITELKPKDLDDPISSSTFFPPGASISFSPVTFSNFSPAQTFDSGSYDHRILGKNIEDITSVSDCSLYRGSPSSTNTLTSEPRFSQLVEGNRVFDLKTGGTSYTEDEWSAAIPHGGDPDFDHAFEEHAGCFYDNRDTYDIATTRRCFPEHAKEPIFSYAGTKQRTSRPVGSDDFRACFNFHEKNAYKTYEKAVDYILELLSNDFIDPTDDEYAENLVALETARQTYRQATVSQAHTLVEAPVIILPGDLEDVSDNRIQEISQTKTPNQITLFQSSGALADEAAGGSYTVKFSDVLQALGLPTDAANFSTVGLQFLGNNAGVTIIDADTQRKTYNQQPFVNHPEIEWVSFRVTQEKVKNISSVFYHKEPTSRTIREQSQAEITETLPIDNPRYLTFQDKNGNRRQIIYPNVFQNENLEEFLDALAAKEAELNSVAQAQGMPANLFTDRLISKIATAPEINRPDPERNNQPLGFLRANRPKVEEAITWRGLNVEQKHRHSLLTYLNPFKNAFIGERTNGYEMLIVNSTGAHDRFDIDFQKATESEALPANQSAAGRPQPTESSLEEGPNFGNFEPSPYTMDPYLIFSFPEVTVNGEATHFPWFKKFQEWMANLAAFGNYVATGESQQEFYQRLLAQQEARKQALEEEALADDLTSFSRVRSLELASDFPVLLSGGESKTVVTVKAKDQHARLIADEPIELELAITGNSVAFGESMQDLNPQAEGFQYAALGREIALELVSTGEVGESTLRVKASGTSVEASIPIKVFENARFLFETSTLGVVANGVNEIPLTVKVVDDSGALLSTVNGNISLDISNSIYGSLAYTALRLQNGKVSTKFKVSKKAGTVNVSARGGGLKSGNIDLRLFAGPPSFLGLEAEQEFLSYEPGSRLALKAKVFDQYGNPVTTDSVTRVRFEILRGETFAYLGEPTSTRVSGGVAEANLFPGQKIGPVRIRAQDEANNLAEAILDVAVRMQVKSSDIEENPPETLTATLLGFDGGNVTKENSIGFWFPFSGKNQATLSLTAKPQFPKSVLEISPQGKVKINDEGRIITKVIPGETLRVEFLDKSFQEIVGEMVVIPKPQTTLKVRPAATESEALPSLSTNQAAASEASFIELELLDQSFEAKLNSTSTTISLRKDGVKIFELTKTGATRLFSEDLSLKLDADASNFSLILLKNNTPVGRVMFLQNFESDASLASSAPFAPGVTLLPRETLGKVHFEPFFTGNSTASKKGLALLDEEEIVSGDNAPGFTDQGIDDSQKIQGAGFIDGTKFGLLFAAGNSFGESFLPYASDAGIVIGDPTVSINNDATSSFNQDVGQFLLRGDGVVRELIDLDYDLDGDKDVLVVYGEGAIHLLENRGQKLGFLDRGLFLQVGNGVASIAKGDINNDGKQDLVLAGLESCRQGDTCLDVYYNEGGYFRRENLLINQDPKEKIQLVKAGDLNNDGKLDLVTADTEGNIRAFYNRGTHFETQGQYIGNMGLTIDASQNLITGVLVNYPGMPRKNPDDPQSSAQFKELQWFNLDPSRRLSQSATFGENASFQEDTPLAEVKKNFIYADLDPRIASSTKFAVDENGGTLENGDRIAYTITLRNSQGGALNNFLFADVFSEDFKIDLTSVRCINCAASEKLRLRETVTQNRPYLFFGITIPGNGNRVITYSGTHEINVTKTPRLLVTLGNNLSDDYPVRDQYLDLGVTTEDNPTGQLRFFYSTGLNAQGKVNYASTLSAPDASAAAPFSPASAATNFLGMLSSLTNQQSQDAALDQAKAARDQRRAGDSDEDGIPDGVDDFECDGSLDNVNTCAQALVSSLRCDAGCVPTPQPLVLLAPGNFSILGQPGPFDQGLPVFGVPVPCLVPFWPACGPYQASAFRIYVAPNVTTGGVGTSLCAGAWLAGGCITFAFDALSLISDDLCEDLAGAVEGGLASANAAIAAGNQGLVLNAGGQYEGASSRETTGPVNYNLGSYQAPVSRSVNTRIPGFPAVITDWLHAQINEVQDKLLDLPDLYIIYPDFKSMGRAVTPPPDLKLTFGSLFTYINSIPLIDIWTEDVILKVPIITRKEFERVKYDLDLWVQDFITEIEKFKTRCLSILGQGGVGESVSGQIADVATLCNLVSVRAGNLVSQIQQNLDVIEEWLLFPKKVLDYRQIEAYFARQIINLLDQIVQYTGGYLKKQERIARGWTRAARQMFEILRNWQFLIDIFTNFEFACDKCRTERFTLKDLIIRFFVALPQPPVIPFPKWPDFIVDLSKIQAGMRVNWPAVRFKPEPLILPRLPRIKLPLLPFPGIELLFPDIPVLQGPPALPTLPDLSLNLPRLPDLIPPPPKFPPLPDEFTALIDFFNKLLRLLCIVLTGLMPVPELELKAQVEAMTTRMLSPLLPIDFLVTVQAPSVTVEYVDQIIVKSFLNLNVETDTIVEQVKNLANSANARTSAIGKLWNKYFQTLSEKMQSAVQPTFFKQLEEAARAGSIQIDVGSGGVRRTNYAPNAQRAKRAFINQRGETAFSINQLTREASFTKFKTQWRKFVAALERTKQAGEKAVRETPREHMLRVTSEPLKSVDDVIEKIKSRGEEEYPDPWVKSIVEYRDQLVTYAENLEKQNSYIAAGDLQKASQIAMNLPKPEFLRSMPKLVAEMKQILTDSTRKTQPRKVKIGELDLEETNETQAPAAPSLSQQSRLLAVAPGGAGESGGAGSPEEIPVQNRGLYVVDPATGQGKRVLAYTGESEQKRALLFIDFDNDNDQDLIYTTGQDVFLKEYFGGAAPTVFHFTEAYIEFHDLKNLIPNFAAITQFEKNSENVRDSTILYRKSEKPLDSIKGYTLRLKNSPKFFDGEGSRSSKVVDLLPESAQAASGIEEAFKPEAVRVYVSDISGNATLAGSTRAFKNDGDEFIVKPGERLHARETAKLTFKPDGREKFTIEISPLVMLQVPESLGGEIPVEIEDGSIEILKPEKTEQPLKEGMILEEKDKLTIESGETELRFDFGGIRRLQNGDTYHWEILEDPNQPTKKLELDPAFYYGKVAPFGSDGSAGRQSVRGETVLLSPQVCGDKNAPFASLGGKRKFQVPLLKTLIIDASSSHDGEGNVVKYAIDRDITEDSNQDGDPANDEDYVKPTPVFTLGPFENIGIKQAKLFVFDEANNKSAAALEIEVIMPKIILESDEFPSGIIEGHVEPRDQNVPITIARERDGIWTKLMTENADSQGRYRTGINGDFRIDDIDMRDRLIVRNAAGGVVAEINRKLGSVMIVDQRYHLEAFPAIPAELPTRVAIVDQNGVILTFVFFSPDVNVDTVIDPPTTEYTAAKTARMIGVHVKPLSAKPFEFRILPGDSTDSPGATEVLLHGERVTLIDVNADILFMAKFADHLKLKVKERGFDQPVVFELLYDNQVIAEIFIAARLPENEFVKITDQASLSLAPRPMPPALPPGASPFFDIASNDPIAPILRNLHDKGIIQGYQDARGQLAFKKDKAITRAEFAKITLEMLCVAPRKEAKEPPPIFSDILFKSPLDWFYEWTKEANLQGLIFGYQREKDRVTGLFPYRPGNTISRAESAKILLEALETLKIINMSKVDRNVEPWFTPFIQIARNLRPYIVGKTETESTFLITPSEASQPTDKITRGDFALMADRVLKIRNCFLFDNDVDGLKDEWEKDNFGDIASNDGDDDPDRDTLLNKEEEEIGTNPLDPDTDHGGIKDGVEVKIRFTDPLNPADERPTVSREALAMEENIFVVRPLCNACPCLSAVELGAELQPGDTVFASIVKEDTSEVFVSSNELSF